MKANFYLGFEYGHDQDTVEVEIIATTSSPEYFLVKLRNGYDRASIDLVTALVHRDFLEIENEQSLASVPLWNFEQEKQYKEFIQ